MEHEEQFETGLDDDLDDVDDEELAGFDDVDGLEDDEFADPEDDEI